MTVTLDSDETPINYILVSQTIQFNELIWLTVDHYKNFHFTSYLQCCM